MRTHPIDRRSAFWLVLFAAAVCGAVASAQSTYSWRQGVSGNWGTSSWQRNAGGGPVNGPPVAADTANITVAGQGGANYTVLVDDARGVGSVSLARNEATLEVANTGSLVVSGGFTLTGGSLTTAGNLTVGGAFALNGGGVNNSGGGLTLNGAFNWANGTVGGGAVTANNGGTIAGGYIDGSSSVMKLTAGTWTWGSGNIAPNNGGKLQIDAGATLQLTADRSFGSTVSVGGIIENAGLVTKTGGTGSSWIGNLVTFNNTGTVRVTSGSWNVQGGVLNNAGVIDLAGSTFMSVHSGGTLVLNAGASITGGGPLSMTDGSATITVNGNVTSAGGLQMTRGQLNGTGTLTLNGGFDLGFFDSNSVTGLTVNANAGGNWTGTDTPRIGTGTVNINGGTVTWNTSPIHFVDNGALTVGTNGTLNLVGDENLLVNGGLNPTVTVNGLFKKSGGTSNAAVSSLANLSVGSTGTIDVQSGNLYLHPAAITNNGVIKASTGNLFFNNNSGGYTTATLSGTGTLQVDAAGTLNITPGNTRSVVQSGGTFTQNGTLNVTSGTFKVASGVTITNLNSGTLTGGVWNVTNATLDLDGRTVTNIASGTTVRLTGSSASVTGLNGLTQLTGHFGVLSGNTFTPTGTVSNGGTVDVTGTFAGGMVVTNTGLLTGSGTVNGPVTVQADGLLAPGQGTLSGRTVKVLTTGNLTMQAASEYQWQLNSWAANASAGNGFDQVRGTSGAKLDLSGATPADPIVIHIVSLNGTAPGSFSAYNSAEGRSWVIADYSSGNANGTGIIGFSADKFALDTSAFANDPNTTRFSVSTDGTGNRLLLTFTPVPEPMLPLTLAATAAGVWAFLRRRRVSGKS